MASAEDVVFALSNKEGTTRDNPFYALITFGGGLFVAIGHSAISFLFLIVYVSFL